MAALQKLREPKFMDMAIFDWAVTIGAAVVIGSLMRSGCMAVIMFLILILVGVLTHHALGIPTMFNAYLGIADKKDVHAARSN